ncbi:hypothetical protein [Candidatus Ichthyocystis hellenicum]|uniref:hypothetical protein n=1 Tax=Candidatus Ichthyocystis hellenicum TaxID=1561003 RepID=UPI000B8A55BA|nr:hypothetical protein [Candidatus Ichthyocystis hellenicum]
MLQVNRSCASHIDMRLGKEQKDECAVDGESLSSSENQELLPSSSRSCDIDASSVEDDDSSDWSTDVPLSVRVCDLAQISTPSLVLGVCLFTLATSVHLLTNSDVSVSITLCALLGVAFAFIAVLVSYNPHEGSGYEDSPEISIGN